MADSVDVGLESGRGSESPADSSKPVFLEPAPFPLPSSSYGFCRQARPGLLEAAPRAVPAQEGLSNARISSVLQRLTARTTMKATATV